jgi:hypothetical protein
VPACGEALCDGRIDGCGHGLGPSNLA